VTAPTTRPAPAAAGTRPFDGGPAPAARRGTPRAVRAAVTALKYVSLVAGCVVALLPLLVVFSTSFKTSDEFGATGPLTPPRDLLNLDNYVTAFQDGQMARAFVNTALILVVSVTGTVLIGSMAAYAIDRFGFRGRRLVLGAFLVATLVPPVTTQVATFQIISTLGLFDTRWAAVALFTGTDIVSIYIFLQFLRTIPRALDEAALLDGATYPQIYRRIILPLLKPAIATVVILKTVAIYNEFYLPFLYMPSRDLGVVSTSLFRFKGPYGTQWEVISAGVVIAIVPTLLLFLALQRYVYNGFTSGATK
jgi:ABC-type glycerol-3-phosphate transport system permease component